MRNAHGCTVMSSLQRQMLSAMAALALPVPLLIPGRSAQAQVNVRTFQVNNARTGLNSRETILTPANVTPAGFGQLFAYPVDGCVYAQPLYLSNITIPGKGPHNVVFVATQHDSVYAFDADDPTGTNAPYLWLSSLLTNGETPVSFLDVGTFDISPEIGITGTPVIDATNGILYVVAKTKDMQGNYHQRLHALDVHTGLDKPGSPQEITATVNGMGDGSVNGSITFNPLRQNQRSALLLSNGIVYITWASHGDITGNPLNGAYPEGYHGWVIAYRYDVSSHTFTQIGAVNTTPNGITNGEALAAGGIWMSGGGPAADSAGNVYFETGNGAFDGVTNFGDSFVKLAPDLSFAGYFTPYNQQKLTTTDEDLGSGGIMLLPDTLTVNGHTPLMVGSGKEGHVYLVDRNNLGKNGLLLDTSPYSDYVVQKLDKAIGPCFGTPAWFNNTLYFGGIFDAVKAFQFVTTQSQNVNYAQGFAGVTDLSFNGPDPNNTQDRAVINGTRLTLTDGGYEAHSAFTTYKVNTAQFHTVFRFQLTNAQGVGFTFALQNDAPTAVGTSGNNLGYGGFDFDNPGIGNSVAVKFNFFPNAPGESGSSTGIYFGGNSPGAPFINLDSTYNVVVNNGNIFEVVMDYDGANLKVNITDLNIADPSQTATMKGPSATQTYAIDIPGKIGSQLAYAGFTAGTGGASALQEILSWSYTAPGATVSILTQTGQARHLFDYPGTTPAVSANGTTNGIVWARELYYPNNAVATVLHAYDASDLTKELYNSDQTNGRDTIGPGVKFSIPVIANGKVFLGTQTKLVVFGLRNRNFPVVNAGYSSIRRIGSTYALFVTVTNTGNLPAVNVKLIVCALGAASAPSRVTLPMSLDTLLPGQTTTVALTFPLLAGASGKSVPLTIHGTGLTNEGNMINYGNTFSVVLPY